MYEPVQQCKHCGANLSLDDLRKPNCAYCGTVLPHHAQAAQHAELMGRMMGQMVAQQAEIQQAWRAGFGMAPPPAGMPGGPPPTGMPSGPPPMGTPGSPYGPGSPYADPSAIARAHLAASTQLAGQIRTIVLIAVIGSLLLGGAITVLVLVAG